MPEHRSTFRFSASPLIAADVPPELASAAIASVQRPRRFSRQPGREGGAGRPHHLNISTNRPFARHPARIVTPLRKAL